MVSLVRKLKKMYKGSYYYANKKYGKYTKRRPFPNFNDFDCRPAGDFSINEVPNEMNNNSKYEMDKKNNSYITNVNDNSLSVVTEGNNGYMTTPNSSSPVTGDILGMDNNKGLYSSSNSISPVTTLSDSNTDFTMVNSSANEYYTSNSSNPFQSQIESNPQSIQNPFWDASESSVGDNSFTTNFDGMNNYGHTDYYANEMKRISRLNGMDTSNDNIKVDYNSANNWRVEIKRYYPSMPQTSEPMEYQDNTYQDTNMNYGMDTKNKKNKWWKKVIPKKNKSTNSSFISENTFYNREYNDSYEYNPPRYDSSRHSTYYSCYSNNENPFENYKYKSNLTNNNLTNDVLVVNDKATNNNTLYY